MTMKRADAARRMPHHIPWMLVRAVAVWCAILGLASVNGAARAAWLIPHLGETAGRAVSTIVLAALVVLTAWLTIRWIGPRSPRDAIAIGIAWLALTLAFELLAGHYLLGNPWAVLLEDYDLRRGRIWIVVPIIVSVAPRWAARHRRVIGSRRGSLPELRDVRLRPADDLRP